MRRNRIFWMLMPALAITGCVYTHHPAAYTTTTTGAVVTTGPGVAVATPPSTVVATSPRPAVRVYPEPSSRLSITSAAPPPATATVPITVVGASSPNDLAITTSIKQMLETDTTRLYRNVDFAIDNGKVTLRGTVPTDHDRIELQNRLVTMPGVVSVENKLDVEWR